MDQSATSIRRETIQLALIAAFVRLIVLWLMPSGFVSQDLHNWTSVIEILRAGRNPYATTTLLGWPPLWMQIVVGVDFFARLLHIPFTILLRLMLIGFDTATAACAYRLALALQVPSPRLLVLAGIALNPISIVLVCQHANFDSLIALLIVIALIAFVRFSHSHDPVDYSYGAFALGIGVCAKTIPLILAPLLFANTRRTSLRVLGIALLLVPAAIGLSTVYALSPYAVYKNVIHYRSAAGLFGVSGVLGLFASDPAVILTGRVLLRVLALLCAALCAINARREITQPARILLMSIALLAGIIVLGPGYAPQYIAWLIPLIAISATSFDRSWRVIVGTWAVIALITYLIEYALIPPHGGLLIAIFGYERFGWASSHTTPATLTLFRLPLFLAYCALWGKALVLLFRASRDARAPV